MNKIQSLIAKCKIHISSMTNQVTKLKTYSSNKYKKAINKIKILCGRFNFFLENKNIKTIYNYRSFINQHPISNANKIKKHLFNYFILIIHTKHKYQLKPNNKKFIY